jgi:inward rectifier potassium channel
LLSVPNFAHFEVENMMSKATFDPGFTQKVSGNLRRAVNRDGSFNVIRRQAGWRHWHPYLYLVNMSWPGFFGLVFLAYFTVNTIFAVFYLMLGPSSLHGGDPANHFLNAFFFSAHTLTTVGYGTLAPAGIAANFLAALEALMGLMGFAVATGLLFGRVSRPSARLRFSEKMLMSPYQSASSLQFRIVNLRPNVLMELEASMLLMTVEGSAENAVRRYNRLNLEREKVYFLPLTWTIVHPIDETSPLKNMTPEMLEGLQAEFLILIKGYDDTFSQTVHRRFSYRYDEIAWGAKFTSAFDIDAAGDVVLDVDKVGSFAPAPSVAAGQP